MYHPCVQTNITCTKNKELIDFWGWTDKNFTVFDIVGTVDAFTSLECEVVYQPTFSASEETDFLVHVTGGSDLKLRCIAKVHAVY